MSKRNLTLIGIALVAVFGVAAWFVRGAGADSATPYRLGAIRRGTVESTVTSTGKLTALQSVAIGTQVSGRVTELRADYNDRVRAGDLLARIDPTIQQQQVRNAEANLERVRAALVQAERDYQRNKTLFDQQVITEAEFSQVEYSLTVARSNLTSSEVSLEQARQNLSYTQIYAPIDGIVVERNVEPGQTVAASLSAPQLYLLAADLAQMEILAGVDESDIGRIQNGMPVRFTVQAYPDATFEGAVRQVRLSSSTQENVVNYTVVISVDNPDGRLLPGMTASVDFIVERAQDVFLVPNAALRFRATEEMIAQLTDSASIALATGTGGRAGGMAAAIAARQAAGGAPGAGGQAGGQAAGGARPGAVQGARANLGRDQPLPAGAGGATGQTGADGAVTAQLGQTGSGVFVPGGGAARNRGAAALSFANLWYVQDGVLAITQVRTGISDGTSTEITGPDLVEGMEIVIGLTQPQTDAGTGTTNPFQQQQGGFGGPGGAPPGGFAPGGGGGGGFGRP